jgi:chemotaxis protein methyltransferase CheR
MHNKTEINMPKVTDIEFRLIKKLIYQKAGIFLRETKKPLVSNRLRKRLNHFGFNTFKKYYDFLTKNPDGKKELINFIDALTTNESYFFRNPEHFNCLIKEILPEIKESKSKKSKKNINIWSAACAAGEEPYTLAMLIDKNLTAQNGCSIQIVASDVNQDVIERAQRAVYKTYAVNKMPDRYRNKYFTINEKDNLYYLDKRICNMVKFYHHNLLKPFYHNKFDVIICRNVMIYFDEESKNKTLSNLYDSLNQGGYLIVGYSETMLKNYVPLKYVKPTIYKKIKDDSEM